MRHDGFSPLFFRVFAAAFLLLPVPASPSCLPAEGEEAEPSLSVMAGEMIAVSDHLKRKML
jgi:hypothetical protein